MKKIISLFIFISLLSWIISLFSYSGFKEQVISKDEQIIKIESGETFYSLPDKFWFSAFFFKIHLKLNPIWGKNLQAWKYKIEAWTKLDTLFTQLETPINETDIQITILEWWNIYDIDDCLSNPVKSKIVNWIETKTSCISKNKDSGKVIIEEPLISKWDFIARTSNFDPELIGQFNFLYWLDSFEWYLYPDTYFINPNNFSTEWFLNQMLDNFNKRVYSEVLKDKNAKEINDIVNLASIVEKEEKNSLEKATVAWILKKRLQEWWMIWADITVCYPHKLTSEECKMVISKYIEEESEYNTRTMLWLPKTPIWNPSIETINAVLNPKETLYFFYLHDTVTWKIYYWKTNAEHERNKRLYLR